VRVSVGVGVGLLLMAFIFLGVCVGAMQKGGGVAAGGEGRWLSRGEVSVGSACVCALVCVCESVCVERVCARVWLYETYFEAPHVGSMRRGKTPLSSSKQPWMCKL